MRHHRARNAAKLLLGVLAALALLLVPAQASASAPTVTHQTNQVSPQADNGNPTAAQLLAKVSGKCNQVSKGAYSNKNGGKAPICASGSAFYWTSGMAIDCDGQVTAHCNKNTDCCFQPDTSFHQSDGKPLSAAVLPYVVIPLPGKIWSYQKAGLKGGDVVVVIYKGQVEYAVFGDEGPNDSIGEASYATAKSLGIDDNPKTGGTAGPVTYIVFKNSVVSPIESHANAVSSGQKLAQSFVNS
ncbi:MAG TPA: glycoside hydrolase family 75 protein [Pseudonocardiaceae bacterium]|jgi:hypothetical protein|nr:glycoside hydrolase family 75 protein [Pseudonocardiaceae bacterium]